MEYGCIGEHLSHSFSKEIHKRIGHYDYILREVEKEKLKGFIESRKFKGINVTVPYKVDVMSMLDSIDEKAEKIGAVNTIVNKNGTLFGYNTDFDGMTALIKRIKLDLDGKNVLILGTGGTSRTAFYVAEALNAKRITKAGRVKRESNISYEEALSRYKDTQIIINTTPCGMYPDMDDMPVDIRCFPSLEGAVDVIYNPLRSKLVLSAQKLGLKTEGGLYMLASQAVFAAERFFERCYASSVTDGIFSDILRQKENIILIGMPGCGKSTIGELLSARLGKRLIDTDKMIEEEFKNKPDEIINTLGINEFRRMESQVIAKIRTENNCVIATGGGSVLREENVLNLKLNGTVFFIDRPIERICPTKDRPLSSDRESLLRLYEERYEIYKSACDERVRNISSEQQTADEIVRRLEGIR